MAMETFLAMTAAEMRNISVLPGKVAWMACHFSPYGMGLSNLPTDLPAGSMLMVDDRIPPNNHDSAYIAEQLQRCVERWKCRGVLLDFQRDGMEETYAATEYLVQHLPCPTVVSEAYAQGLECPVLLPPVPPSVALKNYIVPWSGREIWLELGLDGEALILTETGCNINPLPHPDLDAQGFADEELCCHYQITTNENSARFTLWRTKKDINKLVDAATGLGITTTVGLYQELQ